GTGWGLLQGIDPTGGRVCSPAKEQASAGGRLVQAGSGESANVSHHSPMPRFANCPGDYQARALRIGVRQIYDQPLGKVYRTCPAASQSIAPVSGWHDPGRNTNSRQSCSRRRWITQGFTLRGGNCFFGGVMLGCFQSAGRGGLQGEP